MTADPKPDSATADLPCHEYGYAADVDKAEAWDAISAKNAEIARLHEQLAEAERQKAVDTRPASPQQGLDRCYRRGAQGSNSLQVTRLSQIQRENAT